MLFKLHHIFIFSASVIALSGVLALLSISSQYRETHTLRDYMATSATEERLSGVFAVINNFPGSAGMDMLFLRGLSSVTELYGDFSTGQKKRVYEDIQQFIDQNIAYDEVYVDMPICTFAVRRTNENQRDMSCISRNPIVNDAITRTRELPYGSVYISPLVAYTRDEGDGTDVIPAILYGTKISTDEGPSSAIVAVVNAEYFLEEVRRLERPGERVYLVNTDGSYIAHSEPAREFMVGSAANFYDDFPKVQAKTLSDKNIRTLEAGENVFIFKRITPTASNFALYDGQVGHQDNRYWVLVAVSEKSTTGHWFLSPAYITTSIVIVVTHAFAILVLFLVRVSLNRRWAQETHTP